MLRVGGGRQRAATPHARVCGSQLNVWPVSPTWASGIPCPFSLLYSTYILRDVRTTEYFEKRILDRGIEREWCERAVVSPVATEVQEDGRVRYWAYVPEAKHYLRVVTEPDGTLLNAFFDRTFERRSVR